MWARRLLLTVALFGLFAGGGSQNSFKKPVWPPNPPDDTVVDSYDSSKDTSTPDERPRCNYLIVSGMLLTGGSKELVCVLLEKCSQRVNLSLALKFYQHNIKIAEVSGVKKYYKCKTISVPETSKADSALLSLQITGVNIKEENRKQVVIVPKRDTCQPLQDKPIYNRNDTITVRWVCYDQDLRQVNKNFTNITFWDPMGNGLEVVRDPPMEHGVMTFASQFSSNAREGQYSLGATDDQGQMYFANLQLQDYRLPRWEATTKCPGPISVVDQNVEISGMAQYSYGKPVQGTVLTKCCRNWPRYGKVGNCFKGLPDICQTYTSKLDENGEFSVPVSLDIFKLIYSGPENYIMCDVTVKENGTDEMKTSYCSMWITDRPVNIQLDYEGIGKYYNTGPIPFSATVTDYKNAPIAFKTVTVTIGVITKKVTTDKDGKASCLIHLCDYYKPNVTLTAMYDDPDLCYIPSYSDQQYASAEIILFRYFSWSQCYMRLTVPQEEIPVYSKSNVTVKYWLTEEGCGKGETHVTLLILLKGKNRLVDCIKSTINLTQGYEGEIKVEFDASEKLSTNAEMLAMIMMKKEAIADRKYIIVGPGFPNPMTLEFEKAIAMPGETVNQIINADPGSFCCLVGKNAAFDQITYNNFSPYSIISFLITYYWGLQYENFNLEESDPPCVDPSKEIFCKGLYYVPTSSYTDDDSYSHIKNIGFVISSNVKYRRPQVCGEDRPIDRMPFFNTKTMTTFSSEAIGGGAPDTVVTNRRRLENYLGISNTIVGADGTATVPTQMPESIAKWESEGFCVSLGQGLGMPLQSATITTFMEFFVASEFPKKVVAGEEIYFVAKAHNYMDYCIKVEIGVSATDGDAIEVTSLNDDQEQCACSGQEVFRTFLITCKKIGKQSITPFARTTKISDTCEGPHNQSLPNREDRLVQVIDVKPMGIPRTASSGFLIPVNESTSSISIFVPQPDNLQEDTWEMQVICTGDTVGLTIQHLKQLMDMPSGCCEQQASVLRTTAIITDYLAYMGEMNDNTMMTVKRLMQQGYSDQLACVSQPGVYSLYRSTIIPNTMVSLLSFWTLQHIKKYAFVEDKLLSDIIVHLASIQDLETGCIKPEGRPLTFQGEKNYWIQLNAIAQLILSSAVDLYSAAYTVLEGAKKCTKDVNFEEMDIYTQVCLLNAFAATNQWDKWNSAYPIVRAKLTNQDGRTYLKDGSPRFRVYNLFNPLTPHELITTSLLLRCMTPHPNPAQEEIDIMAALAATLFSESNLKGVYPSTMSTAFVMDAVTSYKKKYGSKMTNANITVYANNAQIANFSIEDQNKFLTYTKQVIPQPGNYTFNAIGTGSIFCLVSTAYYTEISKGEDAALLVTVTARTPKCFDLIAELVTIEITISYVGPNNGCGMTLVRVKCLTGYRFDYNWDQWRGVISEVEGDYGDMLDLYIDHFDRDPVTWTMTAFRLNTVGTMQNATVMAMVFDTEESGYAQYGHPCYHSNLDQK